MKILERYVKGDYHKHIIKYIIKINLIGKFTSLWKIYIAYDLFFLIFKFINASIYQRLPRS